MNRENISATIADLKTELANVEATKQRLETSINVLTDLLKGPLLSGGKKTAPSPHVGGRVVRIQSPSTSMPQGAQTPLAYERVHLILKNIQGSFTRSKLYGDANNDGYGPIAPGTFANIFSKLMKRGQIRCINGEPGQRNSIYEKTEKINEQGEILEINFHSQENN